MNIVELRAKPRRKIKISKFLGMVLLVICLVLMIELIWLVIVNIPGKTVVADWSTLSKGSWVEALYLREEECLVANQSGFLQPMIATGVMIPQGEILGSINQDNDENVINPENVAMYRHLHEIQKERNELQKDLARINKEIYQNTDPKVKGFLKTPDELKILEQEKERISQKIRSINLKVNQIQLNLNQTDFKNSLLIAEKAGYISWEYDGYEDRLTPERFRKLELSDFRRNYQLNRLKKRVNSGEIVAKITYPFRQWVAIVINPEQTGKPSLNENWYINTEEGWKKNSIIDIISIAKDKMIIGLKSQELEQTFSPERRRKIFINYRMVSGVSIPVQAIFKKGQKTLVKLVKGDDLKEKEIRVIISDGNKAIVEGIAFGTAIISR